MLSLFCVLISLLTVPYLHQVWLSLYTNILGVILVILSGIIFLNTNIPRKFFLPFIFIIAFLNIFTTDDSRLFVIPFLLAIGLLYGFTKKRVVFIVTNLFWFMIYLIIVANSKMYIQTPHSLEEVFFSLFYYIGFISDYFIYTLGFTGILLFAFSVFYYKDFQKSAGIIYIFIILSLSIILLQRSYPYSLQWHNFILVTPDLPLQPFLFGILIIISCGVHINKGALHRKLFALEILIVSGTLLFVTGIFPKTRSDPSSRHLLLAYPLMVFIVLESAQKIFHQKREVLSKIFIGLSGLSIIFHLATNIYNSAVRENATYISIQATRRVVRIHRKEFIHACLLVVGPNYFLPESEDLVNPWGKNIIKVIALPSGSLTDLKTFNFFLQLIQEKCNYSKRFFLIMRHKPHINPLYEHPSMKFFKYLRKTQSILSDQYMMAQYAYMHLSSRLPVETLLSSKRTIWKHSVVYKTYPLFLSEFFHRILWKVPFSLKYAIQVKIVTDNPLNPH